MYNGCLLLLALIYLPKWLWQICIHGKYRSSFRAKLGLLLPAFVATPGQHVVWVHAVSMGEVRAMIALCHLIHTSRPDCTLVISTTTETGLAEAKRSVPQAAAHFILPLDFSWTMRRLTRQIRPSHLILCESDFWLNLFKYTKAQGAHISLINGKISERSCRRFRFFSALTRRLFSYFDTLCVQNDLHYQRFLSLGIPPTKLHITGNLKLEIPPSHMTPQECDQFRSQLGIAPTDPVLVIGSTHAPEEEELLSRLTPLWTQYPSLKILLVPRHPERFNTVALLLEKQQIPYARLSRPAPAPLILIDAMGYLNRCYQIAHLALVAGSYTPRIGGHNIFEPIQQGIPVFFGPYMHAQQELKKLVLSANAGKEVPLQDLFHDVSAFFQNPTQYKDACHQLAHLHQGATKKTFSQIFSS